MKINMRYHGEDGQCDPYFYKKDYKQKVKN